MSIANIAIKVGQLVAHPIWASSKLKYGPAYSMTPEIIPASKPKRNPPKDTVKAIKKVRLFIFRNGCLKI